MSMASCAILSNFVEELWTQYYPQYLSALLRALFPPAFLEIAVNSEFSIYIACLPQSDWISLFRDPSVTVWPSRIRFYVRDVILVVRSVHKQSREKHRHLSLYVQNIPGYREKKEGAFKNTKIKCHFKFYFVTVRKLLWIRPNESSLKEGEGRGVVVLNSSSLLEN